MGFDLSKIGVKKNIPKVNFTAYSGVFIAEPKFGKTTTASKYPNSIIVPFEDGTKGQVANVVEQMQSWDDLVEFIDKLEEHREEIGDSVQTIALDTVNKAYEMCEPYTLRKLSVADKKRYTKASEVPHGQFYPARDKEFDKQITRIENLGFTVLYLSHAKVKTIRPKDGEPYDVYSSTMPDRLEAIIYPRVDYMIFGERRLIDDGKNGKISKRVLVTKGNEMTVAGGRVRLSEDITFDTEDEAMDKFQASFKEEVERRLREAGVTEDIDVIAKRQAEEKKEEVAKYIESQKSLTVEEAHKWIESTVASLAKTKKLEVKAILEQTIGTFDFGSVNNEESLNDAVVLIKEKLDLK